MNDELLAQLRQIINESLDEKLGVLYIERERHFKDHEFITAARVMGDKIKGQACKVVTTSIITGSIVLILWGIGIFIKKTMEAFK